MKLLWITDPWHTLDHSRDSTLRLMEEGSLLGVKQDWCDVKSIRLENGKVCFEAQAWKNDNRAEHKKLSAPSDYSKIIYRTDPPVDLAYLHPLQLLALGVGKKTEMINPFSVLFSGNEKMAAASQPGLMPQSVVSSQWEFLQAFGLKEKRTVLKPLHDAQSHGIELLDWRTAEGRENAKKVLETATQRFQTPVLLQEFLEGIHEGETRLWFLDGKLLAHAKKMPLHGDFRVNIDQGSKLVATKLTRVEKSKIPHLTKFIRAHKIRMAAIDLIEGKVTDFNFTSPGLIRQMEEVLGVNLAKPILSRLT